MYNSDHLNGELLRCMETTRDDNASRRAHVSPRHKNRIHDTITWDQSSTCLRLNGLEDCVRRLSSIGSCSNANLFKHIVEGDGVYLLVAA